VFVPSCVSKSGGGFGGSGARYLPSYELPTSGARSSSCKIDLPALNVVLFPRENTHHQPPSLYFILGLPNENSLDTLNESEQTQDEECQRTPVYESGTMDGLMDEDCK
jgi:hypothetical protein